jgi:hypothetical protein
MNASILPGPFVTRPFATHGYARLQSLSHPQESTMSEDHAKTPLDHVTDTLSQLKEMRHYSKNNVELLTTIWLLFDGELSKLEQTAKIDDLMTRQGELHDALESVIADFEELQVKLQPATEE